MDFADNRKIHVNKRLLFFLIFLIIVLPVVVGVLVWHFMKCDDTSKTTDSVVLNTTPASVSKQSTPALTTLGYPETEPWKNLRLPRYLVPVHYDLTLYPNFYGDNGWFYGNETVDIQTNKDTKHLLIHFKFMNITKTELRDNSTGLPIEIKRTFAYEPNQFWVLETVNTLKKGSAVKMDLQFDGSLTSAIVGFYKSSYVNSITKETRHLATSKFEPVDARRAFPCFDEPNIKAEYTITLIHDPAYTPLSNMPPDGQAQPSGLGSNLVATRFQRSVKMSTYLVCFIVCDFSYIEANTTTNKTIRVYATPDKINQTKYALEIGKHSMEEYEKLFKLPYPLPKQDMIAIPDFVSGAMEHWGLITYRETNLLYDPAKASSANKQRVASVIAHEVAHQWFGNIVTMDWWDDLWLNEGFASFMEYIGVDTYETDWEMMAQFGVADAQPVMVTDAGVQSHPIVVHVRRPSEINEVFDSISYSKGASVIRMLESIMGKDKFFEGIANYLKKYEWGNAKTDDLWRSLGEVAGAPNVKHIMDTWTRQMGYPYVKVSFSPVSGGKTLINARQKRYLADPDAKFNASDSEFGYKWYVSLDYETADGNGGKQILDMKDETFQVDVDLSDASKWIKFNVNQTGFYRVSYPDEMWERFSNLLKTTNSSNWELTPADRSGLVNDVFNLARGGILSYNVALDMTSYLDKEFSHMPWASAYVAMSYISDMFRQGGEYGLWRAYVLSKVKPALQRIGWNETDSSDRHLDKLMRVNLIELACSHADDDCLNVALQLFRDWLDKNITISPNLRSRVYKFGMIKAGTPEDWDKIWDKYMTETVPQERRNFLYALSKTRTVWLLARYLDYANDPQKVRRQDFFTVINYIAANPVGNSLVWNWVRENWEKLVKRFTLYSRSFGRMIPQIVSGYNTEFKLQEVESFFKQYPDAGSGARGRLQAVESIKRNINWMKKFQTTIVDWLKARP